MNPIYLEALVVTLGIGLLMSEAFDAKMDKRYLVYAGLLGLGIIFVASLFALPQYIDASAPYAAFYSADPMAMFFKRFAIICTMVVLVMTIDYAPIIERFIPGETKGAGLGEFITLPIFTCAGLMWMVSATDFIAIFVSLELVTISFYVLVAYLRRSHTTLEAGTKYLILGALSTGFIVYGVTWIFGVTGQTNLAAIAAVLPTLPPASHTALLFGFGLVLIALGFKIGAVPFQFWIPDVYQGAATPISAYLSVASKAAGFIVLVRVLDLFLGFEPLRPRIDVLLAFIAGATLIFGGLSALPQRNFKRLLSYSSVVHAGFILMAVASLGVAFARTAIQFYLVAYLLMTFVAFAITALVARAAGGDDISHFAGLSRRAPWLAGAMMLSMLSLAGIPFTAGFLGKLFVFQVAIEAGHTWLILVGAVAVACGFYSYLLVVRAMYWQPAPDNAPEIPVSLASSISVSALAALILVLGVYPQVVLGWLG
ncbi:MAG TPA: NADH-quinone oxidoreductase subunit N [Chthoniobacterales bacterium]